MVSFAQDSPVSRVGVRSPTHVGGLAVKEVIEPDGVASQTLCGSGSISSVGGASDRSVHHCREQASSSVLQLAVRSGSSPRRRLDFFLGRTCKRMRFLS